MEGALTYFTDIDDPKSLRNQKHPLMMLIGTMLLASLAGIDSFSGFADFTEAHYENLMDYFDLPYGCWGLKSKQPKTYAKENKDLY